MASRGGRTAVVLFNLGGPDRPSAVKPFLFNLFNDPAILKLPALLRPLLAWLIASRRAGPAAGIYRQLGGRSPLLDNTLAQARALEALEGLGAFRVFVAMRYWHPFADETARAVLDFDPERIVLLPLYPQWSSTTAGSSVADWRRACRRIGLERPTCGVCCYPEEPGFIAALAGLAGETLRQARAWGPPRVLFTAHGLPRRVIAAGDPYQWQCERTAAALAAALAGPELDWVLCYQSRVGPLEWIGPSTESEIERAGRDGVPVVMVPIAFVSEHSETLVELDITYRDLAEACGVPACLRCPTVGVTPTFIAGLGRMVVGALEGGTIVGPASGGCLCLPETIGCGGRSQAGRA